MPACCVRLCRVSPSDDCFTNAFGMHGTHAARMASRTDSACIALSHSPFYSFRHSVVQSFIHPVKPVNLSVIHPFPSFSRSIHCGFFWLRRQTPHVSSKEVVQLGSACTSMDFEGLACRLQNQGAVRNVVPPGLSNKSTLQSTFFLILRLLRPHLEAACSPSSLLCSFPAGHLFLQVI